MSGPEWLYLRTLQCHCFHYCVMEALIGDSVYGSSEEDVHSVSGLPEANVDSDEDDDESCPSGDSFLELRDNVRDCLEKGPEERTEDDLLVLLDFMQHMPAFADLPMSVKRELCWKMVFAVVEKAGRTVMLDGEQLDSWLASFSLSFSVVRSQ